MKKQTLKHGIEIYSEAIREHEPFRSLEIYAVEQKGKECKRVTMNHPNISFYSVYGESKNDHLTYCIADCSSLEIAEQFSDALHVFADFNIQVETVKEI